MKVLLQRVSEARVSVAGECVGEIDRGLLLLIGIERADTCEVIAKMAGRVLAYRVFADDTGRMNRSVKDIGGGVLAISQFTLAADTAKGLRAGFSKAAAPEDAKRLYLEFISQLKALHTPLAEGIFGADMQVALVNDGPVTFLLEL